jgi:manganese-dependent inorganic pyrophosphatase
MPRPTYIFGHRNPDADAICAAIAYADLKGLTDEGEFLPARCGNSNVRIDAILDHFSVPLPRFIGDVTPRLREVMATDLVTVDPGTTCAQALALIEDHDVQMLPVVGEGGSLRGTVSIFRLGSYFVPRAGDLKRMRRVDTSLRAIVTALGARVLHLAEGDEVEELYVRVGAMDIASFDRFTREEQIAPERSVIVVGDRRNIQERAIGLGIRLLVVTGDLDVDEDVVEAAREAGVSLVVSPWDSATTAWTVRAATRVERIMSTEYTAFGPEETVEEVRRRTAIMDPAVFMVTGDRDRLLGVFTRRDILRPSATRIILVDHNELGQAVPGAEQVNIAEVVDHHRLGDLRTQDPILFINRPVGSTCTIIADLYRQAGLTPSREMAGVMMGGLVSDTLNLRSPTTTPVDREILEWLEKLAGLTGSQLSEIIFSSGSVVDAHPPEEVIGLDRKVYEEAGVRFAISQVEEIGFGEFRRREDKLRASLEGSLTRDNLDFAALMVTDIKGEDSLLLVAGDPGVIDAITYPEVEKGEVFHLSGVVSRKKQLLPFLTGILRRRGG